MCGIAGLLNRRHDATPAEVGAVRQMTDRLAHRGPDAAGLWAGGPVVLGHRRLSIIDLSDSANQPMPGVPLRSERSDYVVSAVGQSGGPARAPDWPGANRLAVPAPRSERAHYVLTFNGEIYNHRALRAELTDYPFRTHSDTEVILAAYARWGVDCVARLTGMFAFALWDAPAGQLLLARDRLGEKPLYYVLGNDRFLFASEMRALLASHYVPRHLDPAPLAQYLQLQTTLPPTTLVAGVRQLPPGHLMTVSATECCLRPYWQLGPNVVETDTADPTAVKTHVRTLLRQAVARQLASDVPLGAFLSGGIDSSAVVALMAEAGEQPIRTFTLTFAEKQYDESVYATLIAKRFNTRHDARPISARDLLSELPRLLAHLDVPSGDGPNTYLVSGRARQAGLTVALSGLGGDELFGGYSTFGRYERLWRNRWFWALPTLFRRALAGSLRSGGRAGQKLADLVTLPAPGTPATVGRLRQSTPDATVRALLPHYVADWPGNVVSPANWDALPLRSQASVGELTHYTSPLLLRDTDQMSMAHGLEVRVPFFDHELVDYVLGLPDALKPLRPPKALLVDALHPLLPADIVNRPKMGFSLPWAHWLRHELRPFCAERIERLTRRGLFHEPALRRLWRQFLAGPRLAGHRAVGWNTIWLLVVLDEWMEQNAVTP